MSGDDRRIVVIGASLAGVRAVESIRRAGFEGAIALVGAEQALPYDRPPLSKELLRGEWELDRVALKGTSLDDTSPYDELGVDLRLGTTATGLELGDRPVVKVEGVAGMEADGVVVATGARPRSIPSGDGMAGVMTLRTLSDSLELAALLRGGARRLVVVGGGFIGAEVAAGAQQMGLDVTIVEALDAPMSRVLGLQVGEMCAELHRARGVDVRTGTVVEGFVAGVDGRVAAVATSDGDLAADVVVVGIGVVPNAEWLGGSGITVDDGVVCDAACRAAPRVVAAGDVARWPHPRWGPMRVEHWTNAVEQGQHAARSLLADLDGDEPEPFAPVPYVWSDQYDQQLAFCGHVSADDDAEVVWRDDAASKVLVAYHRSGGLQAAFAINSPRQLMMARKVIAEEGTVDELVATVGS